MKSTDKLGDIIKLEIRSINNSSVCIGRLEVSLHVHAHMGYIEDSIQVSLWKVLEGSGSMRGGHYKYISI